MGRLVHIATGAIHLLAAHTVIGRAPGCAIRVSEPAVSSTHVSLSWSGDAWVLRDLGSRNGTAVDGEPVEPGTPRTLAAGSVLLLGGRPPGWRLDDASAPLAHARSGDRVVEPTDDLLLLPHPDEPELVLFFDPDAGWVADDGAHRTPVADGATVVADGAPWLLALPVPLDETVQPDDILPELSEVSARFAVSSDEEHVEVVLDGPHGWSRSLAPRSYHYMLLTLARERVRDMEAGVAEPDQGWVHRDALAEMLRVGPRTLTVHLCRAHKQVGDAGVIGAGELFEHRTAARQVRLNLQVSDIGPLT